MSEALNTRVPEVSVVIPTRNRQELLARAIRSILDQTVQDFEVIVVDDASTQDVETVVRSFADSRLALVRHQAARGGGASRNTGIQRARGRYVAFLDDDDEWLPKKLELQLARINCEDRPGMVYTGFFHIVQRSGRVLKVFRPCNCKQQDTLRRLMMQNVIGTTSTIMVRRSYFMNGLMFDEKLRSCQDWDLYLKLAKRCKVGYVKRPLVKHYLHNDRISGNLADLLQGHQAILNNVMTQNGCTRAVVGHHHFKIGKLALQFGDKKTGREELLRSLSFAPVSGLSLLYLLGSFLHRDLYRESSFYFQMLKMRMSGVRAVLRTEPTKGGPGSSNSRVSMISIVVPLFNKASHIKDTIESVLAQSYRNFELIIVNDGSTDNGPKIVREIKDPRILVIDQANAGVSAARNRGIDAAKGELVAFLDADDLWNPDFLSAITRLYQRFPWAGLYATAYRIVNMKNRVIEPRFRELPSFPWEGIVPSYFRSAALGAPPVWTSACCVPKKVLTDVGGFAPGKRMGEDLDLWGRIALQFPVAFSSYDGAVYCQNAENRICDSFKQSDEHPFFQTAKAFRCAGRIAADLEKDVELYLARLRWENKRQHVLAGNLGRARELFAEENRWIFPLRQLLWGSSLNSLTRFFWNIRYADLQEPREGKSGNVHIERRSGNS